MNDTPKRFALIGAAGYVAPRHMAAIRETGNDLAVALDTCATVGSLDRWAPGCHFFDRFEDFDSFMVMSRRHGYPVEWTTVVTPNHLHFTHVDYALRAGTNVICEKPLVLRRDHVESLREAELATGCRVFVVHQMRLHPSTQTLQEWAQYEDPQILELTYLAPRGAWYDVAWKGDPTKSGGPIFNIGIHLIDLLIFAFGRPDAFHVHHRSPRAISGVFRFGRTFVRWFLSTDFKDIQPILPGRTAPYRGITRRRWNDPEDTPCDILDFTTGFEGLHQRVYEETLAGRGIGIADVADSISLAEQLQICPIVIPEVETAHHLTLLRGAA